MSTGKGRALQPGLVVQGGQIVPVEGDVQLAYGHLNALEALNQRGQPPGQRHAPALDAHQNDGFRGIELLQNFVSHPAQGPLHGGRVHQFGFELLL